MIKAIVLCHPQSKDLLNHYNSDYVEFIRVACGTTKPDRADLYESVDFSPTYASWNSCLFETSVILTVWEHADQLIGNNDIAILHTDIVPHYDLNKVWGSLAGLDKSVPVGLVVPNNYEQIISDFVVPDNNLFRFNRDPMLVHNFDNHINVWDYIKIYDKDIYDWANDTNPKMIYSHQFLCSRNMFDNLGFKLRGVANRLRLSDIGFWTPHMFERLIALYLARFGDPIITTAFWHYSSSGALGPGDLSLYGPRAFKYYNISSRMV